MQFNLIITIATHYHIRYSCWDWWGYTNYLYGVQQGVQVRFVRDMIKDLTGL